MLLSSTVSSISCFMMLEIHDGLGFAWFVPQLDRTLNELSTDRAYVPLCAKVQLEA